MIMRSIAILGLTLGIAACATIEENTTQELTIEIVGTGKAMCDLNQPGYRYRVHAPGTVRIQKTPDPLQIKCDAPGNRTIRTVLTPALSEKVAYGLIPGAAWDYASGAAHKYPDHIVIDYSDMPPRPYDEPDYQKVLRRNPHIAGMEEFRPGVPALQSDIGQPVPTLQPREVPIKVETVAPPATAKPMNAEGLTRTMNPGIFKKPDEDK